MDFCAGVCVQIRCFLLVCSRLRLWRVAGVGTVYEKRPRPASTSNDIHAGCLHWAFVLIEQSFSLCRSGWLAIRSGGYADLALALSAVPLCHPLWGPNKGALLHGVLPSETKGPRLCTNFAGVTQAATGHWALGCSSRASQLRGRSCYSLGRCRIKAVLLRIRCLSRLEHLAWSTRS